MTINLLLLICVVLLSPISQCQQVPSNLPQLYRKDLMLALGSPTIIQQRTERDPRSRTHEVSVCRGHMRSITCPNLELLHIFNAFYGKLSGHDCEVPITQFRNQIPTCYSSDAPDIIRQSCQGQQSCDLYAEDSLYKNPCPGVTKYLFVSFTCQGRSRLPEILKMYQQQQEQRRQYSIVQQMVLKRHQQDKERLIRRQFLEKQQQQQQQQQQLQQMQRRFNQSPPRNSTPQVNFAARKNLNEHPLLRGTVPQPPSPYNQFQMALMQESRYNPPPQLLNSIRQHVPFIGPTELKYATQRQVKYLPPAKYSNMQPSPPHAVPPAKLQNVPQAPTPTLQQQMSMNNAGVAQPSQAMDNRQLPIDAAGNIQGNIPPEMWPAKPEIKYYQDQVSSALNSLYNLYTNRKCDQCDGNCRNILCYGCGGCNAPADQQTYYYPYQRQDAEYHDAFENNAMALSGLVLYPFPRRMKHFIRSKQKKQTVAVKHETKNKIRKLAKLEKRSQVPKKPKTKISSRNRRHRRSLDWDWSTWDILYDVT